MEQYHFDYFMMELAEHEGVAMDIQTPRVHESTENLQTVMVFQEFMDLMPLISEANAISEELKKVLLKHFQWILRFVVLHYISLTFDFLALNIYGI